MINQIQQHRKKREDLTYDETKLLDEKILPMARKWVMDNDGLEHHGKQTLEYWNEPIPSPRKPRS